MRYYVKAKRHPQNQRKTEPRPQVTCTENFVKFGRMALETSERTDRHTDMLIAILRTPLGGKVIMRY